MWVYGLRLNQSLGMLKGLLWTYVMKTPFVERFKIDVPIIQFGSYAYDALGRIAGQCNVRSWIFSYQLR